MRLSPNTMRGASSCSGPRLTIRWWLSPVTWRWAASSTASAPPNGPSWPTPARRCRPWSKTAPCAASLILTALTCPPPWPCWCRPATRSTRMKSWALRCKRGNGHESALVSPDAASGRGPGTAGRPGALPLGGAHQPGPGLGHCSSIRSGVQRGGQWRRARDREQPGGPGSGRGQGVGLRAVPAAGPPRCGSLRPGQGGVMLGEQTLPLAPEAANTDPLQLTPPTEAERLAAVEAELQTIRERLATGDETMASLRADLAENTSATIRTESNTAEIVEFFGAMKGAFKVLNWIGALAKPITALVALAAVTWGAFLTIKTGAPPK